MVEVAALVLALLTLLEGFGVDGRGVDDLEVISVSLVSSVKRDDEEFFLNHYEIDIPAGP